MRRDAVEIDLRGRRLSGSGRGVNQRARHGTCIGARAAADEARHQRRAPVPSPVPEDGETNRSDVVVDTTTAVIPIADRVVSAGRPFDLAARSLMLLRRC